MRCPKCDSYLLMKDLIKINAVRVENVEMEYTAQCPFCGAIIGRYFWGKIHFSGSGPNRK
ncbi:hypothetical protein U6B65_10260 [Oscillospiraceae bacterium MB08-C2-2]|nr:hypothetical protein U6B65_10260 [Oscillospiraceae bacterium MB08-C2-2]